MEAFRIAHDRMVNGRKDLLIVILKEKINVDRLPADLRPYIRKLVTFDLDNFTVHCYCLNAIDSEKVTSATKSECT